MRAVLQRVKEASVSIEGEEISSINHGWLVLIGITADDSPKDQDYVLGKILNTRVFDVEGEVKGCLESLREVLVVSQFTLYGDLRKGRKPNFSNSAPSEIAEKIYDEFSEKLKNSGCRCKFGKFGAYMEVSLTNDGPFTLIVDSSKLL